MSQNSTGEALVTAAQEFVTFAEISRVADGLKTVMDEFAANESDAATDLLWPRMFEVTTVPFPPHTDPPMASRYMIMFLTSLEVKATQMPDATHLPEFRAGLQRLAQFMQMKSNIHYALKEIGRLRDEPQYVPEFTALIRRANQTPSHDTEQELPGDAEDPMFPRMILYGEREFSRHGYRRRHGKVCAVHFTPDGQRTGHWCVVGEIKEVLTQFFSQAYSRPAWEAFIGQGTGRNTHVMPMEKMVTYFGEHIIPSFPEMNSVRYWFSVQNGIFDADLCRLTPYGPETDNMTQATANYLDGYLNPEWLTCDDPQTIPTPALDTIFEAQDLVGKDRMYIDAMMGRFFFDVGSKDNWQVTMLIKGAGGSGKSTLAALMERLVYPPGAVGIMSNEVEDRFGLAQVANSWVVIAPEVNEKLSLPVALFKQVNAGDTVSMAVKNKNAIVMRVKFQMLFCCNSDPWPGEDPGNALGRRVFYVLFEKFIPEARRNASLMDDLEREIVPIVVRWARTYRALRQEIGPSGSFWDHFEQAPAPPMLTKARERFKSQRAPMRAFLQDPEQCVLGEEYETEKTELMALYREWFSNHFSHRKPNWDDREFQRTCGEEFGITMETRRMGRPVVWFKGVGLVPLQATRNDANKA